MGIDVSKSWLDIAVFKPSTGIVYQDRIDNTVKHVTGLLKALKLQVGMNISECLFCMEHTGKYGNAFLTASAMAELNVWVELPLQIKRSQGLVRGKSDPLDAARIAEYAYRFSDKAVLWTPANKTLQELKELQVKRGLLVKGYTQLSQEDKTDPIFKKPLAALKKAIAEVELKMENLIRKDPSLLQQFELLKSIPGIGKQTAIALIVVTKGFTRLTESRKLSCYAGLAPFPHRSGSSIKSKDRVSRIGDMKLKVLLNLSAWNAIRSVKALKEYYERKVAQGKHKLSVINVVRNKLVAMALAVIKRNSPFVKDYLLLP